MSRFPSFAFGENRLRSTACYMRTPPLVPLAALGSPNRGRRVAYGSVNEPTEQAGDRRGCPSRPRR
jgi:hypothetical protein